MKIKVLHLIKTLDLGGAEKNLLNLVKAYDKNKFEIHIGYSAGGKFESQINSKDAILFKYAKKKYRIKSLHSAIIVLRLYRYIRKNKIDVVHTHNFNSHIWGILAAKISGIKIVEHVHDHRYTPRKELNKRKENINQFKFIKYFKGFSDKIIVLTMNHAKYVVENGYCLKENVKIIKNGILITQGVKKSFSNEDIRMKYDVGLGSKIVLTTARIEKSKNIELVINVANKVLKKNSDVEFIICGDGPMIGEYRNYVSKIGIEEKVKFIGYRENIVELLAISEIFLLPTFLELHSISILEALEMKVPIVTSKDVGSNNEFINNWKNGILLDPYSLEGWAEAVIYLLENEKDRKQIGENGYKVCCNLFDVTKIVKQIESIYIDLVKCNHINI